MNAISDNDLILYFYRDGLEPARLREIDGALAESAALRSRYDALRRMLDAVDAAPLPEADAGFTERVWQRVAGRIDAAPRARAPSLRERLHALLQVLAAPRFALAGAALLAVALGGGYYAGRHSASREIVEHDNAMAARVLDAYVAAHLRATEGLLLTAANNDGSELRAGNADLAATLVDSNRLYAAAAARAGNARLADFLRQLEPVLIDLADRPANASVESRDGLREYLRKTDLLFQVRATQARIETAGRHRT